MWKKAIFVLICMIYSFESYAKTVRTVEADESKVVLINTALGYSTIMEFTSKPLSAVLGDQDAFKIEYVGNSITLKPLLSRAQSNLFVFTEYDRFNCTLRTVAPAEVDYIVKVSAPSRGYPVLADSAGILPAPTRSVTHSRKVQKTAIWHGYALRVRSVAEIKGENSRTVTVYEVELSSKKVQYAFSAGAIGVKQSDHFIPIESLFLDSAELNPGKLPVHGKIVILNADYQPGRPLSILFAVPQHQLHVTLSGSASVKKIEGK